MNLEKVLKRSSKYRKFAKELTAAFEAGGVLRPEMLDLAPLLVKTTYGFDIYEVVAYLKQADIGGDQPVDQPVDDEQEVTDGS